MGTADVPSEDDQGTDSEHDPPYWQQLVGREVLAGLRPQEIKRQEVINGEAVSLQPVPSEVQHANCPSH